MNIFIMVKMHRIASGNVNCYIVADNDKAILIDTGRKKYCEKILERCKKFHVSLIVLTHGHMDHCQNAAYLAETLHIPIAINKNDMDLIPDNRKQSLLAKTLLGKIVLSVSLSSFEMDSLEVFDPIISMLYVDEQEMLSSAKHISELGDKTIYFGHGKPKRNRKWVK